jgi:hypothetical protein
VWLGMWSLEIGQANEGLTRGQQPRVTTAVTTDTTLLFIVWSLDCTGLYYAVELFSAFSNYHSPPATWTRVKKGSSFMYIVVRDHELMMIEKALADYQRKKLKKRKPCKNAFIRLPAFFAAGAMHALTEQGIIILVKRV